MTTKTPSAGPGTRQRIVNTTTELFGRHGYSATGMKQIVSGASAPFGSIYHFFPGGKTELAQEVLAASAGIYVGLIDHFFAGRDDLPTATREFFDAAAQALLEADFVDPCPVATVSMEVASTSEPLRLACAAAFALWIDRAAEHFQAAGLERSVARGLAVGMLAALEGAFMLARSARDPELIRVAGDPAVQAVSAAMSARTQKPA